jgi:GAF domain-containing protein
MTPNFRQPQNDFLSALTTLWNWLTAPSKSFKELGDRRKAQLTASLALAMAIFNLIGGIAASSRNPGHSMQVFGPAVIASIIAYIVARTRFFSVGSFLLVLGFCASAFTNIIFDNREIRISVLFYIPIALTIGSALLSWPVVFLLTGLNVGAIFLLPWFGIALPDNIGGVLALITVFGIVLIILEFFREGIERQRLEEYQKTNQELTAIRENLEGRVEERTQELNRRSAQLEASTLVARSAASVHDLRELLESVVEQITQRFGFYQASIFLVDPSEKFVVMQAASSEGGKKMLQRGYRLEIGRQGIVGNVAYLKRPRIIQDISVDSAYAKIPELPNTRSEVALPLTIRNHVIGVLDIQAEYTNAFKFEDIYTLQIMADQIALAIDNTRLVEESRTALEQLETLNINASTNVWKARLGEGSKGYTYTPLGVVPVAEIKGPSLLKDERTITVPLSLRGKNIGVIALKRKVGDPMWVENEREMAGRIANQVALAVENARLLEESQRRAQREQTVNEFSNRFSRSLDVDALLQNAVRELHRLPQVSEVEVFINPATETDKAK